jgi:hypothetical protein
MEEMYRKTVAEHAALQKELHTKQMSQLMAEHLDKTIQLQSMHIGEILKESKVTTHITKKKKRERGEAQKKPYSCA